VKILVTGPDGMLGNDLMAILARDPDVLGLNHAAMDVTDLERVRDMFGRYRPAVVIHAAGLTDVDACEQRPWDALRTNALGTQNVALACQECDAAMLYVSSDYVFSGSRGAPYAEWNDADPVNVYGQSKSAGERAVRDLLRRFFIVRTSGLYGRHGKSFIARLLRAAQDEAEVAVVTDQVTIPTYTRDLAEAIARLVRTRFYGVYHITNTAPAGLSWFDWAQLIRAETGMHAVTLRPITAAELGRPAYRPPYSVLGNTFYHLRALTPMRSCRDALRAFLAEVGWDAAAPPPA